MRKTRRKASTVALLAALALSLPTTALAAGHFSYSDLLQAVEKHQVATAKVDDQANTIHITLKDGRQFDTSYPVGDSAILTRLSDSGAKVDVSHGGSSWLLPLLTLSPLIIAIVAIIIYLGLRQRRGGSRAKAARLSKEATRPQTPAVRFADVAGIDEAVDELKEMTDFLKRPERYRALGARLPRAVMLYGPPGTGKTLLARAMAGEAQVPFYAVSASEFVEMYVGVGARRVRDLFQKAKSHREGAVIFIDEIDAIGRKRGGSSQGTHEEREQTLNQLLVELDGFGSSDRVIVVAATNRLDVLDPALLRPGRFTRHVAIDLPSEVGRRAILSVHSQGKPLQEGVDLDSLARSTGGLSGAQLAEVVNEAAIMAARAGRTSISKADVDEGQLRVLMGPEKRSSSLAEGELEVIAYHEAGHVLTAELCPTHEKAERASVRPRGGAAGLALYGRRDRALHTPDYIHEQMVCALGGRAAEQTVFGRVSTGAGNDLMTVNQMARRAIQEFGLSAAVGQLTSTSGGEDTHRVSDETAALMDREVTRLVQDAYKDALRLLASHRRQLDSLATLLVSQGDLERLDILTAMDGLVPQELTPQPGPAYVEPSREPKPQPAIIQQPFRRRGLARVLERGLEWVERRGRAGA